MYIALISYQLWYCKRLYLIPAYAAPAATTKNDKRCAQKYNGRNTNTERWNKRLSLWLSTPQLLVSRIKRKKLTWRINFGLCHLNWALLAVIEWKNLKTFISHSFLRALRCVVFQASFFCHNWSELSCCKETVPTSYQLERNEQSKKFHGMNNWEIWYK